MAADFRLSRLYAGFVNSYTSLGLAVGNWVPGRSPVASATHAITEWFRRTGTAYGYYPMTERKKRDLEWFDIAAERPVLHMETENKYAKARYTVDKLIGSDAEVRVGLVWMRVGDDEVAGLLEHARAASVDQEWKMLLIIRREVQEPRTEVQHHGRVWHYPMQGHILKQGRHNSLPPAYIEWPERWGQQVARWEP